MVNDKNSIQNARREKIKRWKVSLRKFKGGGGGGQKIVYAFAEILGCIIRGFVMTENFFQCIFINHFLSLCLLKLNFFGNNLK